MFVGSRLAFALMTADLDANLVSRNILIPLLLSDCVFFILFSKSFEKDPWCLLSIAFYYHYLCRSWDTTRLSIYVFFYSKVDSLLFIIGAFLGAHLTMAGCIGVQSICRELVYVRCTIYSSSALDLALQ